MLFLFSFLFLFLSFPTSFYVRYFAYTNLFVIRIFGSTAAAAASALRLRFCPQSAFRSTSASWFSCYFTAPTRHGTARLAASSSQRLMSGVCARCIALPIVQLSTFVGARVESSLIDARVARDIHFHHSRSS